MIGGGKPTTAIYQASNRALDVPDVRDGVTGTRMIADFADQYSALLVLGFIVVIGGGLLAFLALWSRGPGKRPVIFMAAFLGAILLPQLLFHALDTAYPVAALLVENEAALAAAGSNFADPEAVFGSSAMPASIADVRAVYPGVFEGAEISQFSLTASGHA